MSAIELFPGFPLTLDDYSPLLEELSRPHRLPTDIRLAHSLGAIHALAKQSEQPTVLLAPSAPGPRPGRAAIRAALLLASRTPWRRSIARELRRASYRRYGSVAPPGEALPLDEAVARLLRPKSVEQADPAAVVIVIVSKDDQRNPRQTQLARQLGAPIHWVDGGHMFPITHPSETASAIRAALN